MQIVEPGFYWVDLNADDYDNPDRPFEMRAFDQLRAMDVLIRRTAYDAEAGRIWLLLEVKGDEILLPDSLIYLTGPFEPAPLGMKTGPQDTVYADQAPHWIDQLEDTIEDTKAAASGALFLGGLFVAGLFLLRRK